MTEFFELESGFPSARSVRQERALDESRRNLRIWRSVNVNVRLLLFSRRRRATVCRWIYDSGIAFFLVRWIDSRCLLLARGEQPQHSQQVNRFFHIT